MTDGDVEDVLGARPGAEPAASGQGGVVEFAEHVTALLREGRSLSATVRRCGREGAGWDTTLPTCPEWSVRDLVVHLGGVYRWAAAFVTTGRVEPFSREERAELGRAPDDDGLGDWYDEGLDAVTDALVRADPALVCFTLFPGRPPREFWARRMAHETLVHRVDAEMAVGSPVGPLDAGLAADGLDELLGDFLPVRAGRFTAEQPWTLDAQALDLGRRWSVRVGPEGPVLDPDGGDSHGGDSHGGAPGGRAADPDVLLRGWAADLHLVLWNRAGTDNVEVEGDPELLARWRAGARI